MYKVLLVDDEMFVRKGLQKLIRWEAFNYTLIGEAKNGGDALEMIHQFEPDLVITDIMMPVLDGLALIQRVKEAGRTDPEFILISGYNEFKYAQQAIRYGVQDYILKPIDVKELGATLQKLATTISRKRLIALAGEGHALGSILEAMLQENLQSEEAGRYAEVLGLTEETSHIFVWSETHPADGVSYTGLKAYQECLSSWHHAAGVIPVLEHAPGLFGMLLCSDVLDTWGEGIPSALTKLRMELAAGLQQEVVIYAGGITKGTGGLRQSYLQACECLKHKFAEDGKPVLLYEHLKDKPLHKNVLDMEIYDSFILQVEENNREAYTGIVNAIFRTFQEQRFPPSVAIRSLSLLINRVMGVLEQMQGDAGAQRRLLEVMEEESQAWRPARLKRHILQMADEAAASITALRLVQRKGDIERIKKHIDAHFRENLNLKSIAGLFYMNPVYLGQLFRKTYGVYFNDYLLERRIEEAKRLLRQTDLRMYEIAAKVGIPVPNYFTSQFEKLEKITPLEYRDKLVNKE